MVTMELEGPSVMSNKYVPASVLVPRVQLQVKSNLLPPPLVHLAHRGSCRGVFYTVLPFLVQCLLHAIAAVILFL